MPPCAVARGFRRPWTVYPRHLMIEIKIVVPNHGYLVDNRVPNLTYLVING